MDSVHDGSLMTTGPRWQKLGKEVQPRNAKPFLQSLLQNVRSDWKSVPGHKRSEIAQTSLKEKGRLFNDPDASYPALSGETEQIRDTCRISSGPHTPWAQKPGRKTVCTDRQDTDFFLSDGVSFRVGCEKVCTVLPPFLPGRGGKRFVTTEVQKGA